MTVQETLTEGIRRLKTASGSSNDLSFIDTPGLDAALLLAEITGSNRAKLLARGNDTILGQDSEKFFSLIKRRINGECVAYIRGRKEFRGLSFTVGPDVLVPRPDTETLVEAALECIKNKKWNNSGPLKVLDLCTGSGAVAISLKNEMPELEVWAADISDKALEIAKTNTARLLHPGSVKYFCGDLYDALSQADCPLFRIITGNPPYVPSGDLEKLKPEVRREPVLALDGGEDGLFLIRKIIDQSKEYLAEGGVLLLEADTRQMPEIRRLLERNNYKEIRVFEDLAGRERVISGSLTP